MLPTEESHWRVTGLCGDKGGSRESTQLAVDVASEGHVASS